LISRFDHGWIVGVCLSKTELRVKTREDWNEEFLGAAADCLRCRSGSPLAPQMPERESAQMIGGDFVAISKLEACKTACAGMATN
jgi:hypothetical protein